MVWKHVCGHVCKSGARTRRRLPTSLGLVCGLAAAAPAAAEVSPGSAAEAPLQWSVVLEGDAIDTLRGGLLRGGSWDALARLDLRLDGAVLGLPPDSAVHASLARTQGEVASHSHIGDVQNVSNLEADPRSRVYELWYGQPLGANWRGAAGLIAADVQFDTLEAADVLLNGSFGAQPTWSGNTVAPIFPTAGVGAMATWSCAPWTHRIGVFQADPGDRASALRSGALLIDETAWQRRGTYKFGLWGYDPHGDASQDLPPATWGAYASAEQPLRDGDDAPIVFVRAGWSAHTSAQVGHDLQAGLRLPGPLPARPQDQLALGVARAQLREQGAETTWEIAYRMPLSRHVTLQPDLQYVQRPGGNLPSALVALLRLHVELD